MDKPQPAVGAFVVYTVSLLMRRLFAAVIALMLMFMIGNLITGEEYTNLVVCLSGIPCFLLFLFFVYRDGENTGGKDYNLCKYGRRGENLCKGLWAGLLAEAPFVIFLALVLALQNAESYNTLNFFLACVNYHYAWLQLITQHPWVYLLVIPVLPATAWAGYRNGFKQIDIWLLIPYKTRKTKQQ